MDGSIGLENKKDEKRLRPNITNNLHIFWYIHGDMKILKTPQKRRTKLVLNVAKLEMKEA